MRKIPLAFLLVAVALGTAFAQDPYAPAPPPPQPYPQPAPQPDPQPAQPQPQPPPPPYQGGYAPPPQQYVPAQLSADDHALLQQGEISESAHIGGAVVGLFFGFGVGQAVQGRYSETGWIFTLGQGASLGLLIYGLSEALDDCFLEDTSCNNNSNNGGTMLAAGLIGLVVFRVWEIVDAFGGPPKHNRRVRALKMRLGIPVPMYTQRVSPFVHRSRDGGGTAGLTWRF